MGGLRAWRDGKREGGALLGAEAVVIVNTRAPAPLSLYEHALLLLLLLLPYCTVHV